MSIFDVARTWENRGQLLKVIHGWEIMEFFLVVANINGVDSKT